MPLFRRASGGGGGVAAVTLLKPDGTSTTYTPAADSALGRGAALALAYAAAAANDLILLGVGTFRLAQAINMATLSVRGQGRATIIQGDAADGTFALRATTGTNYVSDCTIQYGIYINGAGHLDLDNVRVEGTLAGLVPVQRLLGAGTLRMRNSHLRGNAALTCITSPDAMNVYTVGCSADVAPDSTIALVNPEGLLVSAALI